jgi:hypothetical protein
MVLAQRWRAYWLTVSLVLVGASQELTPEPIPLPVAHPRR